MGRDAQHRVRPESCDELRTFWDGHVVIDVSAADYNCLTELPNYWVRGIESGDTSGGNVIKVDHEDMEGTGSPQVRTNVSLFMAQGALKAPLPRITKVYSANTTVGKTTIGLYYQRKRV